jgi:hypothetical protein
VNDSLDRVKRVADTMSQSSDTATLERAAQLLKCIAEIENQRAQAKKSDEEVKDTQSSRKGRNTREVLALLVPLITTLILVGTLALQTVQFTRTERDKAAENERERVDKRERDIRETQAAEDASWNDALKVLTATDNLAPSVAVLKRFAASPRYAEPARLMAVRLLLLRSQDPAVFRSIFGSVFVPVTWGSLPQVVEIDRDLFQRINPILAKAWDEKAARTRWKRVRPAEHKEYDALNADIDLISGEIAVLLKGAGSSSHKLDLENVGLWDTDLQGANLSGADLTAANASYLNLRNANLSRIEKFDTAVFAGSTWWEASTISPSLLDYLKLKYPPTFDTVNYFGRVVTKEQYARSLQRLSSQPGN